jgi:hypothetical protein
MSVTEARLRYAELLEQLYRARDERGPLSMREASERAGMLEDLWYQLTPALGRAYNSGFRCTGATR